MHLNNSFISRSIKGHGLHFVDGNLEPLLVDGRPILPLMSVDLLEPVRKKDDNDDENKINYFKMFGKI